MATLIITVLGDDRSGLVDVLSGAIADRNGSWVRSHMAELAGKFAGVVEVNVADAESESLLADLDQIRADGLLHITAEHASSDSAAAPASVVELRLVGQDHPGIVHEISKALAQRKVSIDELQTETIPAPQGGYLFQANARLELPADVSPEDLENDLEALAHDLMVELDVDPTQT